MAAELAPLDGSTHNFLSMSYKPPLPNEMFHVEHFRKSKEELAEALQIDPVSPVPR